MQPHKENIRAVKYPVFCQWVPPFYNVGVRHPSHYRIRTELSQSVYQVFIRRTVRSKADVRVCNLRGRARKVLLR